MLAGVSIESLTRVRFDVFSLSLSNKQFLARLLACVEEAGAPDFPSSTRFFVNDAAETVWKKAFDLVYYKIDEIPTEQGRYQMFEAQIIQVWNALECMEKMNSPCREMAIRQYSRYKLAHEWRTHWKTTQQQQKQKQQQEQQQQQQQQIKNLPSLALFGIVTTTLSHACNTQHHQQSWKQQECIIPSSNDSRNCQTQYVVESLSIPTLGANHHGGMIENYSQSSQRKNNGTTKRKDSPSTTLPSVSDLALRLESSSRKKKRRANRTPPDWDWGWQQNQQTKEDEKMTPSSSRAIPLSSVPSKRNSVGIVLSSAVPQLVTPSDNNTNGSTNEEYEYEYDYSYDYECEYESDGSLVF
jgi:hypothetical protein